MLWPTSTFVSCILRSQVLTVPFHANRLEPVQDSKEKPVPWYRSSPASALVSGSLVVTSALTGDEATHAAAWKRVAVIECCTTPLACADAAASSPWSSEAAV